MAVEIRPVQSQRELRAFIKLPWQEGMGAEITRRYRTYERALA
jgi:hypothetical protein